MVFCEGQGVFVFEMFLGDALDLPFDLRFNPIGNCHATSIRVSYPLVSSSHFSSVRKLLDCLWGLLPAAQLLRILFRAQLRGEFRVSVSMLTRIR
jgi:hypothetical protein